MIGSAPGISLAQVIWGRVFGPLGVRQTPGEDRESWRFRVHVRGSCEALPEGMEQNVILAPWTSMGVGGPARYFARARDESQIVACLEWATTQGLPVFCLGAGSNVVVGDAGFDGLVVHVELAGTKWRSRGDDVVVTVSSGAHMDDLCAQAVARGLAGIECLSGIPGTVGAAPVQNIGAYGQELSMVLEAVDTLEVASRVRRNWTREACRFGYRSSRFQAATATREIIVSVTLALKRQAMGTVRYPELAEALGGTCATLANVRRAVLALRASKSMLLDPNDVDARGCGSFFVNPVLEPQAYERFCAGGHGDHPHFITPDGGVKIPAAWLIERAGFHRGLRRGAVGLSRKHVQAIVNYGDAAADDVLALAAEIQQGVFCRFGVALVPEPVFLGCRKPTLAHA